MDFLKSWEGECCIKGCINTNYWGSENENQLNLDGALICGNLRQHLKEAQIYDRQQQK